MNSPWLRKADAGSDTAASVEEGVRGGAAWLVNSPSVLGRVAYWGSQRHICSCSPSSRASHRLAFWSAGKTQYCFLCSTPYCHLGLPAARQEAHCRCDSSSRVWVFARWTEGDVIGAAHWPGGARSAHLPLALGLGSWSHERGGGVGEAWRAVHPQP